MEVKYHEKFCPFAKIYWHSGSITYSVSNHRHYSADLEQGGLEIPYKTNFSTSISVEKEKAETVIAAVSNFGVEKLQINAILPNLPKFSTTKIIHYTACIAKLWQCLKLKNSTTTNKSS